MLHKISVKQFAAVIVQGSDQGPFLLRKRRPQMRGSIMLYQSPDGGCDHLAVMGLLLGMRQVATQLFRSFGDCGGRNLEALFLEPIPHG